MSAQAPPPVSTDQPGTLIVFPKVISDGTRDTLIEITNTSNMTAVAHCVYVDANDNCQEHDFDVCLTAQQPTVWEASTGRGGMEFASDGLNPGCSLGGTASPLPVGTSFRGELKCFQIEPVGCTGGSGCTDVPFNGNALIGTARLFDTRTAPPTLPGPAPVLFSGASDYNAIAFQSTQALNTDNTLGMGTEISACPQTVVLSHFADGTPASTPVGSTITTELTLVPCTEDLEHQTGGVDGTGGTPVTVHFETVNELELPLTGSIQFSCWLNDTLTDLGIAGFGTDTAKTRIGAPINTTVCYSGTNKGHSCTTDANCPGSQPFLGCLPASGVIGVAEEFFTNGTLAGNDSFNLDNIGSHQCTAEPCDSFTFNLLQ